MKIRACIFTILLLAMCSGCASSLYEGLRHGQEMDCYNLQGFERDECLQRTSMSYDEYQRQLKERDQKK
jgi:hypothetical protein